MDTAQEVTDLEIKARQLQAEVIISKSTLKFSPS